MMLIRIIIMLLIALFVESRQEAFGQTTDTLSLSDKVIRTASFATGFRGEIWQNPALYYYYTPYTWTRLDVNGAYHDKGKASLKQEGDKDTRIGVDVNSFVILSERDRVFGSAGYRSEKQENVLWNENIDWKLIAPYVTGDSIGGFLKGETYYFNGGYASESGSWTWGDAAGTFLVAQMKVLPDSLEMTEKTERVELTKRVPQQTAVSAVSKTSLQASPKTGDDTDAAVWGGLMAAAVAVFLVFVVIKRKK